MAFIQIQGTELFYEWNRQTETPPLLLLHGSGCDHTVWPKELRYHGRLSVIALDLPGHGKSKGTSFNSVKAYSELVRTFVEKLGIDHVTLVGHSLGGAIAMTSALTFPKSISKLILVGTGARLKVAPAILEGLMQHPDEAIDLMAAWSFGPEAPQDAVLHVKRIMKNTDPGVIQDDLSACNNFDIMERLHDILVPTVIFSGSDDRLTPLKYGKYLHDHIPQSTLIILEKAGHMMALEKPVEFVKEVSK